MTNGRISVSTAAKVLHMDAQTAFKKPGSNQYSYLIYSEPFKQLTGYKAGDAE